MAFLERYNDRDDKEKRKKAVKYFERKRQERIQVINACQQASAKCVLQNCFGEMEKGCLKKKEKCEAEMLNCLVECDFEKLRDAIKMNTKIQMEEIAKDEEKRLSILENFRMEQNSFFKGTENGKNHHDFITAWNRYHTIGRDLNGFFRFVNDDYRHLDFEQNVAKSMATETTVFRNDLSTKTVSSDIISSDDDTETGSCSTPSLDSSYELENLSNDCISITEEMAILKEENEESQRKRKRFDFEGDTN
jgi:hypothetical protein